MKTKPDIRKIIANIKKDVKAEKKNPHAMRLDIDYTKPFVRHRDMRQDAIEQGSHGAQDLWGDENAGTI